MKSDSEINYLIELKVDKKKILLNFLNNLKKLKVNKKNTIRTY